ncbi:dihydroxyacetone kinase subunit DhaK [Rhodobacter sp. KR11]|uniref:dihydroxyacetone kinase subunit DhaK n=1 Tax=Rhodobacter sp. KR11 TaxID=2974588 RepID=UPI0022236D82|nr:dihydroxyacetone kinase subunit DhaK [Rhodobacter sp. KR11]MCW1919756.1 dihydroxyacetone kinase subunit DhaK [Rhodobacter sp. KR11]
MLDATQSMDLAVSPCSRLQTGRPTIDISPGEMEIGTGLRGETGMWRGPLAPAYAVVDAQMAPILAELGWCCTAPGSAHRRPSVRWREPRSGR